MKRILGIAIALAVLLLSASCAQSNNGAEQVTTTAVAPAATPPPQDQQPSQPSTTAVPPVESSAQQPSVTPTTTSEPSAPTSSANGGLIAALMAAIGIVTLALVAAVVLLLRYRRTQAARRYNPQSAYTPPANRPPGTAFTPADGRAGELRQVTHERDALALTLIDIADAVRENPAQLSRIHRGLERAGYQVIDPAGQRFDSRYHEGLHNRPTDDPAQDLIVAATVRPGYRRGTRVVRQPEVVVYQYRGGQGDR